MLSGSCGIRDEPYVLPPGQTPCCWSAACHGGGIRNIYKLKATSCGLFCIRKPCPRICLRNGTQFPLVAPLGDSIPLRLQIPGRIFRQAPQPETASHSKAKFRDAFSDTPPIRKARPTLTTSSERMRACRPRRPRHRGDGKCHPKRLPRRGPLSKKASRTSRLSHLYCFARRTANGGATRPARPSWRLRPCCPSPP